MVGCGRTTNNELAPALLLPVVRRSELRLLVQIVCLSKNVLVVYFKQACVHLVKFWEIITVPCRVAKWWNL